MSRIGRQPVIIPAGVKMAVAAGKVTVEGPKGKLERVLPLGGVAVEVKDGQALVSRPDDTRRAKALHGLVRSLVNNMVVGVTKGYEKELHIEGVGYRAAVAGSVLNLTLGYSHPVEFAIPKGITITVDAQTEVKVSGTDKELVGQVAANIRKIRKPEPYKGKGVRYAGERVIRKAGKAGK